MEFALTFACLTILLGTSGVIATDVIAKEGTDVTLPCLFQTEEDVNQISWQRVTGEKLTTDNFYTILPDGACYIDALKDGKEEASRFSFQGDLAKAIGTIAIKNIKKSEAGKYTCVITLFPSGNRKKEIILEVNAPLATTWEPFPVFQLPVVQPLGSMTVSPDPFTTVIECDPWVETNYISRIENGLPVYSITLSGMVCLNAFVTCNVTYINEVESLQNDLKIIAPPRVIAVEMNVGEKTATCVCEGAPFPQVVWIDSEGRTSRSQTVTLESKGLYTCLATNAFGNSTGFLLLERGENYVWLSIVLTMLVGFPLGVIVSYYFTVCRNLRVHSI